MAECDVPFGIFCFGIPHGGHPPQLNRCRQEHPRNGLTGVGGPRVGPRSRSLTFFVRPVALVTSSAAANGNYSSSYYPTLDWSDPFDWQLLKYGSGSSGNVLMSPVSLKIVLALLYEGAAGNTEKEFQAVLNFDNQKRANAQRFQAIIESLRSPQNADGQVQFATGVFLDSSIDPQQNFAATARYYYNADIVATNFSQSANASNLINGWIQSATAGKVLHLVDPGNP